MKKFIKDSEARYDDEKLLWGVYVGPEEPKRPLDFTAWGNSETQAHERARKLCNLLNDHHERSTNNTVANSKTC